MEEMDHRDPLCGHLEENASVRLGGRIEIQVQASRDLENSRARPKVGLSTPHIHEDRRSAIKAHPLGHIGREHGFMDQGHPLGLDLPGEPRSDFFFEFAAYIVGTTEGDGGKATLVARRRPGKDPDAPTATSSPAETPAW